MRTLAVLGFLAAAAVSGATPGHARYEGPWCAKIEIGGGTSQDNCQFATFEACRQEIYLNGPTTQCTQNPRYLPYWRGRGPFWQFDEQEPQVYAHPRKRRHRQH